MKILSYFLLPMLVFAQGKTFKQFIQASTSDLIEQSSITHMAVAYGSIDSSNTILHFGESTTSSLYDLASLTKVFTSLLFVLLENESSLNRKSILFNSPRVTYEDLLRHRAGLPIGVVISSSDSAQDIWNKVFSMRPKSSLRGKFRYSDINYILLGHHLTKRHGISLDKLLSRSILEPLGMKQTNFAANINLKADCPRTARLVQPCHVHDPTSSKLGSITGHAGLFSSIGDLVLLANEILLGLENRGQLLNKSLMSSILQKDRNGRFIGFDSETKYARRPTGNFSWSKNSFGHTGFTGTSLFIDPKSKSFLIILSNAVYKKTKGDLSKRKYFNYLEKASLNFTHLQK
ncbi:beta-lactamase family protein [Bacteriovoracaceae bacterium]|nr:beta-lactamase family protein [Bacteriovoracaceae bacterium]